MTMVREEGLSEVSRTSARSSIVVPARASGTGICQLKTR